MRIILKPIGAIIIGVMIAVLIYMVMSEQRKLTAVTTVQPTVSPVPPSPTPLLQYPWTYAPPTPTLQNAGFEEGYESVRPYDTAGILRGQIAGHWYDDSSWTNVTADYAQDTMVFHGGNASERIIVRDNQPASVQLVQYLRLTSGQQYRAGFWLKAERPTLVDVLLREAAPPCRPYSMSSVTIGPKWQLVTTAGAIGTDSNTYLMLRIKSTGTVWVDDATLTPL